MENIIYILFVSIFIPILLMTMLVEKKARVPVMFMLFGIFVSVFASEVNGVLVQLLPMSMYDVTVIVTPISEELLKRPGGAAFSEGGYMPSRISMERLQDMLRTL